MCASAIRQLIGREILDSRATPTVEAEVHLEVGRLLRLRGSGPVLPLALAWARNRG